MFITFLISALALLNTVHAVRFANNTVSVHASTPSCRLIHDGRIPSTATPDNFDKGQTPFQTSATKGPLLAWVDVVSFPPTAPSLFDLPAGLPFDVAITDLSTVPDAANLRRTSLAFTANTGDDRETNTGARTFHFSVKQPWYRNGGGAGMDYYHQYTVAAHATRGEAAYHFRLVAGTLLEKKRNKGVEATHWKLLDRKNNVIFHTPIDGSAWQNFAVTLEFFMNKIRVHYSNGAEPLQPVTDVLNNDNSGLGRFTIGLQKYPEGVKGEDSRSLKGGKQEAIRDAESQIFGGVFVEDSTDGCVSR